MSGKFHGQRSLAGFRLRDRKESGGTEHTHRALSQIKKLRHREVKQFAQVHTVKIKARFQCQKPRTVFFDLSIEGLRLP